MDLLEASLLGVLQGVTEFFPVNSSGHMVLAPWLLGWALPGLAFDVVVHFGTALAIFPGFSRSGATIAAGLALGLQRGSSARFSFLLATPITIGARLLKMARLIQSGDLAAQTPALALGLVTAGTVVFGCIHFLLRYLQRCRLYPFAVYCVVVGVACLFVELV